MDAINIQQYKKAGGWDYPTKDSNLIDMLQPVAGSPVWPGSYLPSTTTGLTFGYSGGQMLVDGVLTIVTAGTLALSASTTNYIEMTRAGVLSKNTTGFTAGSIPLYQAVTSGAAITSLTDKRNHNQPSYGRLALATTGGTTTLTTDQLRVNAIDITGALASNAAIVVSAVPGAWIINNGTTGAYSVTLKVSGQTGVAVYQGKRRLLVCDGTDVRDLTGYLPIEGGTILGAVVLASTLTLAADPVSAMQPATKQFVESLVVGLLDDRGSYNASGNVWPSSGGSGSAGAILKGDLWYISVAGTLGGTPVAVGDTIRALVDTPGSTASNWDIMIAPVSVPAQINSAASKATPVDADKLGLVDSAASWVMKHLTWANLKATLKTYFDTLYAPVGLTLTSKSAAYTTVLGDANNGFLHPAADTTARTWTIDSNANVAYPVGTTLTFVNENGAGTITIAITSDTMRWLPNGTTGSRTLAANGQAVALKITTTSWQITGVGLT